MSVHPALQTIDQVYRRDARRVFATLEQWPQQGVPENPPAWLVSTGRFKAIDGSRRQARFTSTETMVEAVESNRAVAVAMHAGCERGIALVDDILKLPSMQDYHLAHAARADMCRRLQRGEDARMAYQAALELTQLEPERHFLESASWKSEPELKNFSEDVEKPSVGSTSVYKPAALRHKKRKGLYENHG